MDMYQKRKIRAEMKNNNQKEKGLLTVDDYQAEKDKIMFYRDALLKELKKRDKSNNISN